MTTIKTTTKRNISRQIALTLVIATVACAAVFLTVYRLYSFKAGTFAFLGFEMLLFTCLPPWAARIAKLRKIERAQQLEEYRASPESHILRLNH